MKGQSIHFFIETHWLNLRYYCIVENWDVLYKVKFERFLRNDLNIFYLRKVDKIYLEYKAKLLKKIYLIQGCVSYRCLQQYVPVMSVRW